VLAGAPVRAPWPLVECCACAHSMAMQCACAWSADAQAMPSLAQWHTCPEEALLCVFPRERSFPRGFSKKSLPQIYARRHSTTRKLTSPALRLAFGSGQSARRPERLLALGSPPDWGQQPRLLPWPRNPVRSTERGDAAGPEASPASLSHEAARALDQRALWGPSPRTRRA
jgi:hypothetical protein